MRRTSDETVRLFLRAVRRGVTVTEAAKRYAISKSTATRVLQQKRKGGEIVEVKKGRPGRAHLPVRLIERHSDEPFTNEDVDEAVDRLLETPFPYPGSWAKQDAAREVASLTAARAFLVAEEIRPRSSVGIRLCAPLFPNRYEARSAGQQSAVEAWADKKALRAAVRFQLAHDDPVEPHRVLRAITLRCRTPTIFRPLVARFVCERYGKHGTVWDPCAGYGGRLLGAHVASVRYIGTDVDVATVDGNRELAELIGATAEMHLAQAETFSPPRVDLVFTSPPYFDRERYSDAKNQSWYKYRTLTAWIDGFLRPVVQRAHSALRNEGHLVLNVADLRRGGETVPIVARTLEVACSSGFHHVETLRMPLAAINRKAPFEPILVFKK